MPISIQLPSVLREYVGGRDEVQAEATTVYEALRDLVDRHPVLRRHLFAESGELRVYVNVYVNQDELRDLPGGVHTALRSGDVLTILPSIAGG